jgi:hypothetical protein
MHITSVYCHIMQSRDRSYAQNCHKYAALRIKTAFSGCVLRAYLPVCDTKSLEDYVFRVRIAYQAGAYLLSLALQSIQSKDLALQ